MAVSERPPTSTRALRSPAARRPAASTSSSSGRRIEAIRPLKSSSGAGQAGDQPGGDEDRGVAGVAGDLVLQFGCAVGLGGDRAARRLPPVALRRACTRATISTW